VPYIGKQLVRGQNRKLDDISSGFNGSQTTFTLQIASQNVSVGSALQLWISVGGVIQNPLTDFTIAGNQITFTTAPAASLDFFGVIQGDVTDTNTPGDATVTTSKLATGLTVNLADGSAATSSLQLGGTDSGLFSSAADKVNVTTGGVERLEIGSSEVVFNDPSNDVDFRVESNGQTHMLFVDAGNDRIGIGAATVDEKLHLEGSSGANTNIKVESTATGSERSSIEFYNGAISRGRVGGDNSFDGLTLDSSTTSGTSVIRFRTAGGSGFNEKARLDASGRLLVGTSSAISGSSTNDNLQLVNSAGSILSVASSDTTIADGTRIGEIEFWGQPGSTWGNFATISCKGDATAASNDNPGRLTFSTTADGASSPTERLRLDSSGNLGLGVTAPASILHVKGGSLTVEHATPSTGTCQLNINSENNSQVTLTYDDQGSIVFGTASTPATQAGFSEKIRIDSSGRLLVGTSAGTSSPNAIQTGGGGTMISSSGSVSNNGTLSITVGTSNICFWSGFLFVNNIDAANGSNRTQSTFSVFADNQNASSQFTQIASRNGSSSRSFTVTYVDNGIIRFTNTSGSTCNVSIGFFGGGINMG